MVANCTSLGQSCLHNAPPHTHHAGDRPFEFSEPLQQPQTEFSDNKDSLSTARSSPKWNIQKEFHIAPMLDVSTIEFRYFMRLLTKRAVIWTEMVVAETLVHRNRQNNYEDNINKNNIDEEDNLELDPILRRYCGWWDERDQNLINGTSSNSCEVINPHPTVCQIGTNDPDQAAFATHIVHKCGYDRIDLNAECPSDRVTGKREFGAALMKDQDAAVAVVRSMVNTVKSLDQFTLSERACADNNSQSSRSCLPVSVKTRIGVDENDSFEFLVDWVQRLVDAGCSRFVIHARKVYTQGLSPAQNRTVPPLDYPCVYCLMDYFPDCEFLLNGGIMSLEHALNVAFGHSFKRGDSAWNDSLTHGDNHVVPCGICNMPHGSCLAPSRIAPSNLHGVMVGRLARDHPSELADVDRYFYGETSNPCISRRDLMEKYISFLERVYPRRCCDADEMVTLGMITDMERPIVHQKDYCNVCQELNICCEKKNTNSNVAFNDNTSSSDAAEVEVISPSPSICEGKKIQNSQSEKRHKRLSRKSPGAKIVSRVIDRALQPTLGILFGQPGNSKFRRELHRLSRDTAVRNCGPGHILREAMLCISQDIWDQPFALNDGTSSTNYIPSK